MGAVVSIILIMGIFGALVVALPNEFYYFQPDAKPSTQDPAVASYYSAHNLTAYENTWSLTLNYPDYAYNESGLTQDERVEIFWQQHGDVLTGWYRALEFRHAYPSPIGAWWLWWTSMHPIEPYFTDMNMTFTFEGPLSELHFLFRIENLLSIARNETAFFTVTDDRITQNFVVMPANSSVTLADSWVSGQLRVLSTYSLDFDAMKPNAFWLMAQLITFQSPDFGLPTELNTIVSYPIALAFWIIIALLLYTLVTRLIPTIQGGIEN